MKKTLVLTAIAVIVMAATTLPASAAGSSGTVFGGGSGTFPAPFGALAGDRLSVELTARALPSGATLGRFHLVHLGQDGGVMADLSGTLDCLVVSNGQASATGTITAGFVTAAPGFDPAGQTFAFTVLDQGSSDLAGADLSFFGSPHTIAPCATVPLYLAIDQGNFTVTS